MKFKIRASAIGQIMTEAKDQITSKQIATLDDYRKRNAGEGRPLTDNQKKTLTELEKKMAKGPQLSETCKQYVREWYIQEKYKRKKLVATKAMMKGNENEIDSMVELAKFNKVKAYFKNEQNFENEFMTGTPDIILKEEIIDIKSSYDLMTFHKGEGVKTATSYTGYGWQLMGYMALTGKHKATLAYVLTNSPEWIVESEVKKAWHQMHIESEEEQDYFDKVVEPEIRALHHYGEAYGKPEVPLSERVIQYSLEYDKEAVERIKERVELINDILNNRIEELWN